MKSELHIINMINTSDRARIFISNLLGKYVGTEKIGLLFRLAQLDTLSSLTQSLGTPEGETFAKLALKVERETVGRYAADFTTPHLQNLTTEKAKKYLAEVLDCSIRNVFNMLFDTRNMLHVLFQVAPTAVFQLYADARLFDESIDPPAHVVLDRIIDKLPAIKAHFHIDDRLFGDFIDERQWIKPTAEAKLRDYATRYGFVSEAASSLLVEAIKGSFSWNIIDDVELDTLALQHIQQHIQWIITQLCDEVNNLNGQISSILPDDETIARVQAHIEFYESRSPAKVWNALIDWDKTNTAVHTTQPGSIGETLRLVAQTLRSQLIPALILAGVYLPDNLPDFYDGDARTYQLPVTPTQYDADLTLTIGQTNILERVTRNLDQKQVNFRS